MIVKRKQVEGQPEKQFLTGMIVSDEFLSGIVQFADLDLIEADYARTVAEWCWEYYKRYEKAPGIHIKDIFETHASKMEPVQKDLIKELLTGLSDEYERAGKMNIAYMLDQAEKLFKSRSIAKLDSLVRGHLAQGSVAEAEAALGSYKRIGRPMSLGGNPFKNVEAVQRAFEAAETPLITFPGALGKMWNRQLTRDSFVGLMGPEKRGKTWWLNEIAVRAAMARRNVALFQIGDMSQEQVTVRLACNLCRKGNQHRKGDEVLMPVPDCRYNQMGVCPKGRKRLGPALFDKWEMDAVVEVFNSGTAEGHIPCSRCQKDHDFKGSLWYIKENLGDPLEWREAYKVGHKFLNRIRGRDFKLSVHPSDQLSVSGLIGILNSWEAFDGFIPDVIVIDYADNLAGEEDDNKADFRHKENRKWKLLRGLSQERHCLVVTATQAAGRSYKKVSMEMDDYSEDKRKYAHVTAMFGLNQTNEEKRAGIMRMGTVVQREGAFFSDNEVHVAQALWAGQPVVFSF